MTPDLFKQMVDAYVSIENSTGPILDRYNQIFQALAENFKRDFRFQEDYFFQFYSETTKQLISRCGGLLRIGFNGKNAKSSINQKSKIVVFKMTKPVGCSWNNIPLELQLMDGKKLVLDSVVCDVPLTLLKIGDRCITGAGWKKSQLYHGPWPPAASLDRIYCGYFIVSNHQPPPRPPLKLHLLLGLDITKAIVNFLHKNVK